MTVVHGKCDPAFAAVRYEFAPDFEELSDDRIRGEIAASMAVFVQGRGSEARAALDGVVRDVAPRKQWAKFLGSLSAIKMKRAAQLASSPDLLFPTRRR